MKLCTRCCEHSNWCRSSKSCQTGFDLPRKICVQHMHAGRCWHFSKTIVTYSLLILFSLVQLSGSFVSLTSFCKSTERYSSNIHAAPLKTSLQVCQYPLCSKSEQWCRTCFYAIGILFKKLDTLWRSVFISCLFNSTGPNLFQKAGDFRRRKVHHDIPCNELRENFY